MPQHTFAVFMEHGSAWNESVGVREQRLWTEHADFMDGLTERGAIVLAGPWADEPGSMVIVDAESADQVREWFAADPWSVHDILRPHEIKAWTLFIDQRTP